MDKISLGSYAEDLFIEAFIDVFGADKSQYLMLQYPFSDIYGRNRNIDFALECGGMKVAIEIDGANFHDPKKVSGNKYEDDLLRQNSLIYNNWKVYRWTCDQLKKQTNKVKDELVTFLGDLPLFNFIDDFLPKQKGNTIELKEHQTQALDSLKKMREHGQSIALLYHATGTGKTVTAVSDAKYINGKTLFVAHTKELIAQAKRTFEDVWSEVATGLFTGDIKDTDSMVTCASIQSISQNLELFNQEEFRYIVIDEAHHSSADTYKKILRYFKPEFILGLTATPDRADGENILEIFKNVAHKMDLKTAVEFGELVPIRCIRVKTNVDISQVRFNGIKYNAQDLESKLFVPERNKVIVDNYIELVKDKKTVVFCASVKHAEDIASLFRENGVKAEAISGGLSKHTREKVLRGYENGDINVLCACDLLNEGWDSPKTEVLFMARPTMSKTIYMQQLGRGTRKYEGKEYLMVFDFIDNSSLFNAPLSAHRMFELDKYIKGGIVVGSDKARQLDFDLYNKGEKPVINLDFPIDAVDYEVIDLFDWQNSTKDMISEMEFVKRVVVQAETINRYIREAKLVPDLTVPMGIRSFHYFKEDTFYKYIKEYGWEEITPANMKDKFIDMVKKMDMSFSYKPVLLMAILDNCDDQGKVALEDIVDYFIDFYKDRLEKGLVVEKPTSIYAKGNFDKKVVQRNVLSNPFKRFEDMRFMKHSKDLALIEVNKHIWKKLTKEDREWIYKWCEENVGEYYLKIK